MRLRTRVGQIVARPAPEPSAVRGRVERSNTPATTWAHHPPTAPPEAGRLSHQAHQIVNVLDSAPVVLQLIPQAQRAMAVGTNFTSQGYTGHLTATGGGTPTHRKRPLLVGRAAELPHIGKRQPWALLDPLLALMIAPPAASPIPHHASRFEPWPNADIFLNQPRLSHYRNATIRSVGRVEPPGQVRTTERDTDTAAEPPIPAYRESLTCAI